MIEALERELRGSAKLRATAQLIGREIGESLPSFSESAYLPTCNTHTLKLDAKIWFPETFLYRVKPL